MDKPDTTTPARQALTTTPEEYEQRLSLFGEQANEQHGRWVINLKKTVINQLHLGAIFITVDQIIANDPRPANKGGGRYEKGSGFKGWLAKFLPGLSERTAYRLMDLAQLVRHELRLGVRVKLEELLTLPEVELRERGLEKKMEKLLTLVDGKSQRQLLLKFQTGGPGEGRGKYHPRKPKVRESYEVISKRSREGCRESSFALRKSLANQGNRYKFDDPAEIETLLFLLDQLREEVAGWHKTPDYKRLIPDPTDALTTNTKWPHEVGEAPVRTRQREKKRKGQEPKYKMERPSGLPPKAATQGILRKGHQAMAGAIARARAAEQARAMPATPCADFVTR